MSFLFADCMRKVFRAHACVCRSDCVKEISARRERVAWDLSAERLCACTTIAKEIQKLVQFMRTRLGPVSLENEKCPYFQTVRVMNKPLLEQSLHSVAYHSDGILAEGKK